ncbi:NAD(P)-dependent oxidoreductase [Geomonas silvestris]|uniref:NAD(P)-dependent oxidoreductase n=1 Tax=Geomonas silvestris TaxID=2740184 RepID=A0A6V8MKS5_9BACT|nr:SDR family oxidoreductase [Geomonas silvestris]GFO60333.1 NAD(P)-dependent oxidoreductase [Geomonas silvestris]
MEHLFIIGFGYVGKRIATLAREEGRRVSALNRKGTGMDGVELHTADLDDPASLAGLPVKGAGVIFLAPPPGGGNQETRMRNFLASLPAGAAPAKLVYLSTSAVYGDCQGEVVTEESPAQPQTSRGKRRLDGEEQALEWGRAHGVPVVVLRVGAIYAADRLPFMQLQNRLPVLREDLCRPTNRIHAEDLARVCLAALERGRDGAIYNVSDGHPTTMTDYFNRAADCLGLPRPPQVDWEEARRVMTPLMLTYFSEARILDNGRMLRELGVTLRYPDLAAGLAEGEPKHP